MKTLINLIGEQPIPNLLTVLYLKPDKTVILYSDLTKSTAFRLKKLIDNCNDHKIEPYDIYEIRTSLNKLFTDESEYIFNITGGTKIMSVALYQIAVERKSDFIYIKSEGNQNKLYCYKNISEGKIEVEETNLPELINIDLYLKAHLTHYNIGKPNLNSNPVGYNYEKSVCSILERNGFEVLSNVKPAGEGNQLEIDLVLRLKGTNNVGIAEVKLGDKKEEGPKKGIDQLALASQREYLGIYTQRFLITSRQLSSRIKELALAHKIIIVDEIEETQAGNGITEKAEQKLIQRLKEKLA